MAKQQEEDHRKSKDDGQVKAEAVMDWQLESSVDSKLYDDAFTVAGLRVDAIEPGRSLICSFTVPPRLMDASNTRIHGGALASLVDLVGSVVFFAGGSPVTGVSSLEITISYLNAVRANEEIQIEARIMSIGETTGCVTVEVRNKATGVVIVHGRHTKYLAITSCKL